MPKEGLENTMKPRKIVGRIDWLLKARIDNIQDEIDELYDRYPEPPAHLEESFYQIIMALFERKQQLIKKIA